MVNFFIIAHACKLPNTFILSGTSNNYYLQMCRVPFPTVGGNQRKTLKKIKNKKRTTYRK